MRPEEWEVMERRHARNSKGWRGLPPFVQAVIIAVPIIAGGIAYWWFITEPSRRNRALEYCTVYPSRTCQAEAISAHQKCLRAPSGGFHKGYFGCMRGELPHWREFEKRE